MRPAEARLLGETPARDARLRGSRCLVLGGGGFIGSHLCRGLLDQGAQVQTYGRPSADPIPLPPDVIVTHAEFSDRVALARAIVDQEYVFHLVGGSNPESSNREPAAELTSGVVNTVEMLHIARAEGVRKVIFLSSGGTVYGVPEQVPIPETAPTNPISAYGINKLATEKLLLLYHHLYKLDYQVLRVANPYGRNQSPHKKQGVISAFLYRALSGMPLQIWGTGEVTRDFIHVEDVVAALIEGVCYSGAHRVMNVGSGVGRSINDVVGEIEKVLDRGKLPVVRKAKRHADVPINVLDISLITKETGWRQRVAWIDGLHDLAKWTADELKQTRNRF
jgi:UDP-glucose 4-epimerase